MEERDLYAHMEGNAWMSRVSTAEETHEISLADADLIRRFIEFKTINKNISSKRKTKITEHLVNFRKLWSRIDYAELTLDSWTQTAAKLLGSSYKQNTKCDYISIVKDFLRWGIKKKYITKMTADDVAEVVTPRAECITKAPEDLVSDTDVYTMLTNPHTDPMMSAMVALLYWTGARIGEVLTLRWKDINFGDQILQIRIKDTKSARQRYAPCCEALEFVSRWRSVYPDVPGGPNGDNFVFLSRGKYAWKPMSHSNAYQRLVNLSRSVLGRHIHPHLYRASDITNSAAKGIPDSVIKEVHWGNQSTARLKTYLLLNNEQVESAMYKRAGIAHKDDTEVPKGPIQCNHCWAMNIPGSSYCRLCGQPLTKATVDKQRSLDEAIDYVNKNYTVEEMIENMASVLGITKDAARKLLTGGI